MRFGPLKPVGLEHPVTGETPHAVVQLRQDNFAATLYNIVGFQTHLKWPEQERVFRLIPGLEKAEFVRLVLCIAIRLLILLKYYASTLQMADKPIYSLLDKLQALKVMLSLQLQV